MTDPTRYVLTLSCPDRTGIVAAVTGFLANHHANLVDAAHFNDEHSRTSFVRALFHEDGPGMPDIATLSRWFEPVAERFSMTWAIRPEAQPCRTLIAVSKASHCLQGLLHRWSVGALPIDVVGVVSNHETLREHAEFHDVPFFHLPIEAGNGAAQERRLLELIEAQGAELLVLARYMRVLSPALCEALRGRCINIHHSFLPGFKGAKPYHQAWERGVKLIGATAHFVTEDLDEGPIIEQAVERVDHTYDPPRLVDLGRDLETIVLTRAVKWYAERRVFGNGKKTVVLKS
ncbi:MAG: formyltetrahydrofolate deformylase [Pseudomonadales bacterium]|nr:formyltetrahydrofolate deformylase [Pseudomonadales bacterium]